MRLVHNIADLDRALDGVVKNQVPFATALALNDAAGDVKEAEVAEMQQSLDRPTPFTLRGLFVNRAKKRDLVAEVGFKRIQSGYLGFQVRGGLRRPAKSALLVPVGARLNRYGNLPKSAVARAAGAKAGFIAGRGRSGTGHLRPGVYRRVGRGGKSLKLLVGFEDKARYTPRFDFKGTAEKSAGQRYPGHFARRLKQALATAK